MSSTLPYRVSIRLISFACRNDDKAVTEYKVTGGSVLHLVLALRGGQAL